MEKLKIKAVSKIREFFLQKINQFKKPLANYQIPQNAMLRFKFYFQFLQSANREVAQEIRDEYTETMAKIMFSYFKSYTGGGGFEEEQLNLMNCVFRSPFKAAV